MKILFDVASDGEVASGLTLLVEAGKEHCSYAVWQPGESRFQRLAFATFSAIEVVSSLDKILGTLPTDFVTVHFCSAFEQSVLAPQKLFKENDPSVLDAVYHQPTQVYHHDAIPEWQMVNSWSLPREVEAVLTRRFASVNYIHAYTPSLKVYNGFVADHQLSIHFTPAQFRILFKKDSAVQLAQTYGYKTPLDVVYYLLKICQAFDLPQSDLHLIVSGLIDAQSALFTELQAYFNNVHFAHPPTVNLPEGDYQQHYFTPLYNLAQCVS